MVSRTPRQQVVAVLLWVACIALVSVLYSVFLAHDDAQPVYEATNHALDLEVLDGIVAASAQTDVIDAIKAVVVPHHLVASESIARGIQALVPAKPNVVVVLSPDHFNRCATMLCTTYGAYQTFFGEVAVAEDDVRELVKADTVSLSNLFEKEHGVYTIAPFIKHYLPHTTIVPLVLSQKTRGSAESRAALLAVLEPILARDDVALVVSSDFSHYLPLAETKAKDVETQRAFCAGNSEALLNLENPSQSDCPLCLWLLEQQAKRAGFWNPILLAHTNSAELMNDDTVAELTSHFTFALSQHAVPEESCPVPAETPVDALQLLVVGDMNFDRYIRQVSERRGSEYIFSCIDPLLHEVDVVVGNLEGPITEHTSVSMGTPMGSPNNYRFTFPITTAPLLVEHNIRIVNIGNNHSNDFGAAGIASTKQYLSDAGVAYFGGLADDNTVHRLTEKGVRLSFVNYNQFGGDAPETVAALIAREHEAGQTVLVYTHWGEEYTAVTERVRSIAQLFAESGASIIIGSHPHVVQEHEIIGKTPVYYSLGNFIFDQYWDGSVTSGLGLRLTITPGNISIEEMSVTLMPDGRTCPAP
jgi:AmmeMemoRadiSam system protein B